MNIVVSPVPGTVNFDVWVNSAHLVLTRQELIALNAALVESLRRSK